MLRESSNRMEDTPGASYWLIERDHARRRETLTFALRKTRRALPVFSFSDEAELFLGLEELERDGWRVSEATAGDLLRRIVNDAPGVEYVALDPLPEMIDLIFDTTISLVTLGRQRFIHRLIRESTSVSQSRSG